MARIKFFWFAATPGDGADGLFDSSGIARWIRKLSGGIFPAAADINKSVAIGREGDRRNFLAVIFEIGGEAAGFEIRTFGNPDIAPALLVERPRDTIAGFRRGQIRWEWRAHDLLEREALLCLCMTTQSSEQNQEWNCYERTLHLLLLRWRIIRAKSVSVAGLLRGDSLN